MQPSFLRGMNEFQSEVKPNSAKAGSFIADLTLLVSGLILISGNKLPEFGLPTAERNSILFLIIISIVPWYMGYLLHYFQGYPKTIRLIFQWVYALIILALLVFFVINFMSITDIEKNPNQFQSFLIGFGMFFLVLGPMMLIGGIADAAKVDSAYDKNSPYVWPEVTFGLILLTFAIFFMILIIGQFDPEFSGNSSFWVVLLAFLGGPLLAVIGAIPFIYIGLWLQRIDVHRILPKIIAILIPLITFTTLIYWNDIVVENMRKIWDLEEMNAMQLFWTLFISGVLPFRIIMLFKPPFSWLYLFAGVTSMALFFYGIACTKDL